MLSVADLTFWQAVQSGGDIAIYAILYYVHNINSRVITLEIEYKELKGWVNRLDNRVESALEKREERG
jgi:glutathione S-transferase